MELCSGCEAVAPSHPWIGVFKDENGKTDKVPICHACHKDPAHRKHKLKMHFFPRAEGDVAVKASEDNIMVDKAPVNNDRDNDSA